MKRRTIILLLAVLTFLTAISPQSAHAAPTAGASAHFADSQPIATQPVEHDNRAEILRAYLQSHNSPLADHAETIVEQADKNNIDWRLVAAISGVESQFGIMIPDYSYNGWGFGVYGNNVRRFSSWDEGISVVSTSLRKDYLGTNPETNVYQIGSRYAASPTWSYRVTGYMNEIDQYSQRFENPTVSISL